MYSQAARDRLTMYSDQERRESDASEPLCPLGKSGSQSAAVHTLSTAENRAASPSGLNSPAGMSRVAVSRTNGPHRPGGGLCRWPDLPLYRSLTPATTHQSPRFRGAMKTWTRMLERRWREEGRGG